MQATAATPLLDAFQLRLFYVSILFTVRTLLVIIALGRKICFEIVRVWYLYFSFCLFVFYLP